MKGNIIVFVLTFILAFAGGYFIFHDSGTAKETASEDGAAVEETELEQEEAPADEETESTETDSEEGATVSAEGEALSQNNCLSCHAVESLGLQGGTTGPDLSNAYIETGDKHGKDLDAFLQEPTSAVMSTVIADNPLDDAEREKIVEALKQASEK